MASSFELDYQIKIKMIHRLFVANPNDLKTLLVGTIYCLVLLQAKRYGDLVLTTYRMDLKENEGIGSYAHMCATPIRII